MHARLGISDKNSSCDACELKLVDCAGNFGHINSESPVRHAELFLHLISSLQEACKHKIVIAIVNCPCCYYVFSRSFVLGDVSPHLDFFQRRQEPSAI